MTINPTFILFGEEILKITTVTVCTTKAVHTLHKFPMKVRGPSASCFTWNSSSRRDGIPKVQRLKKLKWKGEKGWGRKQSNNQIYKFDAKKINKKQQNKDWRWLLAAATTTLTGDQVREREREKQRARSTVWQATTVLCADRTNLTTDVRSSMVWSPAFDGLVDGLVVGVWWTGRQCERGRDWEVVRRAKG